MQAHYPDFIARLAAEDRSLPEYVREEFDEYLRCGVLDHGFLRVVCEQCREAWRRKPSRESLPRLSGSFEILLTARGA